MIDVHCHLNFHAFRTDVQKVITEAIEDGITKIINVGTKIDSSRQAVELAEAYDNLYAIIGVHPHHADKIHLPSSLGGESDKEWITHLEQLAKHPKVLAIGEIGMDYFEYASNGIVDPKLQRKAFIEQIELAHKLRLPLQIHSRNENARIEVIKILKDHVNLLPDPPGMFHCMAGSIESLKTILQMGFYVGFDGNLTYDGIPKGEPETLKTLASYAPIDRLVIETDSPYLPPVPHRGERNQPKYAIITAHFLAKLKQISYDSLVEQVDKNVYTVFKKLKV